MYKVLVEELSIEVEAHAHYAWVNKVVWARRVWLILIVDLNVYVVKIVFANCFGGKNVALRAVEGEWWEIFMGGAKKATIKLGGP